MAKKGFISNIKMFENYVKEQMIYLANGERYKGMEEYVLSYYTVPKPFNETLDNKTTDVLLKERELKKKNDIYLDKLDKYNKNVNKLRADYLENLEEIMLKSLDNFTVLSKEEIKNTLYMAEYNASEKGNVLYEDVKFNIKKYGKRVVAEIVLLNKEYKQKELKKEKDLEDIKNKLMVLQKDMDNLSMDIVKFDGRSNLMLNNRMIKDN